jgi:hypothetical protein
LSNGKEASTKPLAVRLEALLEGSNSDEADKLSNGKEASTKPLAVKLEALLEGSNSDEADKLSNDKEGSNTALSANFAPSPASSVPTLSGTFQPLSAGLTLPFSANLDALPDSSDLNVTLTCRPSLMFEASEDVLSEHDPKIKTSSRSANIR